jgi:hypothetical protein
MDNDQAMLVEPAPREAQEPLSVIRTHEFLAQRAHQRATLVLTQLAKAERLTGPAAGVQSTTGGQRGSRDERNGQGQDGAVQRSLPTTAPLPGGTRARCFRTAPTLIDDLWIEKPRSHLKAEGYSLRIQRWYPARVRHLLEYCNSKALAIESIRSLHVAQFLRRQYTAAR